MLQNRPGSDNEWSVNTETVGQATEGGGSKSAVAQHVCAECETRFYPTRRITPRNPARFCSKVCACRAAGRRGARAFHQIYRQDGVYNGNFKGWASLNLSAYARKFRAANPEKVLAHRAVSRAVRSGALVRPLFCESCLTRCQPQAHHDDYSKRLVVDWLCRQCHRVADSIRREREWRTQYQQQHAAEITAGMSTSST